MGKTLDFSNNTRVNGTAETSVGSEGHEQSGLPSASGLLLLNVRLVFKEFLNATDGKVTAAFESGGFSLHLRCGDHLHGLSDLLDGANGLHSDLELLQVSTEAHGGHSGQSHSCSQHLGGNTEHVYLCVFFRLIYFSSLDSLAFFYFLP